MTQEIKKVIIWVFIIIGVVTIGLFIWGWKRYQEPVYSVEYKLNETDTYTAYITPMEKTTDYIIPLEYEGKPVTEIKRNDPASDLLISKLEIGGNIEIIGDEAFAHSRGLTRLEIPESVTHIGQRAFYDSADLQDVVISGNLQQVDTAVFGNCPKLATVWWNIANPQIKFKELFAGCDNINTVILDVNTQSIRDEMFDNCKSIERVVIRENVSTIGANAFRNCDNLQQIFFSGNETQWQQIVATKGEGNDVLDSAELFYYSKNEPQHNDDETGYVGHGNYWHFSDDNGYNLPIEWEFVAPSHKVTFVAEGTEKDVYYQHNQTTIEEPPVPGKKGYIGKWEEYTLNNSDITVNAIYTPKTYTVYFDYNGADVGNDKTSITVTYDHVVGVLPNPSKTECRFDGWILYDDITITASTTWKWDDSDSYTLVAKFTETPRGFSSDDNSLYYTINDDNSTVTVIIHMATGKVFIPRYVEDKQGNKYEVSAIGKTSMEDNNLVESVILPSESSSEFKIEAEAFKNFSNLSRISLPDSVTEIGENAFLGCAKLNIVNVNSLESWCRINFKGEYSNPLSANTTSKLYVANVPLRGEINLSENIETLPELTFRNSLITSITIPQSVTSFGKGAFDRCFDLKSITIPNASTVDDLPFIARVFGAESYQEQNAYIPENLTKVIIKGGDTIGKNAFYGCANLVNISIPNSVTTIEDDAFYGCDNLSYNDSGGLNYLGNNENPYMLLMGISDTQNSDYSVSATTKFIYNGAFANRSNIKSIIIPNSVVKIGVGVFEGCDQLEKISIPFLGASAADGQTDFIGYLFGSEDRWENNLWVPTSLKKVEITGGSRLGKNAFMSCEGIQSIVICEGITEIDENAFSGCVSLKSFDIPQGVLNIGSNAFSGCSSLQSITINDGVESIGVFAFANCFKLQSIKIPNSVVSIASGAFLQCNGLDVDYNGTILDWCQIAFGSETANPMSVATQFYLQQNGSKQPISNITIPEGITEVGQYQFFGLSFVEKVVVSESVESIGEYAFAECSNIEVIDFGTNSGLTEINNHAFYNCVNLQSISLPAKVSSIQWSAFEGCNNLQKVDFEQGSYLNNIGYNAFRNCGNLKSITMAANIRILDAGVFSGCESLQQVYYLGTIASWCEIYFRDGESSPMCYANQFYMKIDESWQEITEIKIPESVTTIGENQFANFCNITTTTISDSVTDIGYHAFANCINLQSVKFTDNSQLQTIGDFAFYQCEKLEFVSIPNNVTSINRDAFNGCENLQTVSLNEDSHLDKIEANAFNSCYNLRSITIPGGVTSIGEDAFHGCFKLVEVWNYSSSLQISAGSDANGYVSYYAKYVYTTSDETKQTTSGDYVFLQYKEQMYLVSYIGNETDLVLPATAPDGSGYIIYPYAFYSRNEIQSVVISNGVKSIEQSAFEKCGSLQTVTIADSVTNIGYGAFMYCDNLETVIFDIGSQLQKIDDFAFFVCNKLQSVFYGGNEDEWESVDVGNEFNGAITEATRYYYSPEYPWDNANIDIYGLYWHWDSEHTEATEWICISSDVTLDPDIPNGSPDYDDVDCGSISVRAKRGESMPSTKPPIPAREGYTFNGYFTEKNGVGTKYYDENMNTAQDWDREEREVTLFANWIENELEVKPTSPSIDGIKTSEKEGRTISISISNGSGNYGVKLDGVELDKDQVIKDKYPGVTVSGKILSKDSEGKVVIEITITAKATDKQGTIRITIIDKRTEIESGLMKFDYSTESTCFVSGTLITLADGSRVPVEKLTGNEELLVWDFENGCFAKSRILFVAHKEENTSLKFVSLLHLNFSDNSHIEIVGQEGFWNVTRNEATYINEQNANEYVGDVFNKNSGDGWKQVRLESVEIVSRYTNYWSPISSKHMGFFANDLLVFPGLTEIFNNILAVNSDTMKYDEEKLQADIECYGLYTFEEFVQVLPIPESFFEAFDVKYLKIAFGKGLISWQDIIELIKENSDYLKYGQ